MVDGIAHREAVESVRAWQCVIEELMRQRIARGMSEPAEERAISELDEALNLMRAERIAVEAQLADEERRVERNELLGRRETA